MTLIVGHRGAGGYAPQNTLLSFQKAIEVGCQRTELDVRLSKDNKVIVIHNESVDEVSDGHGLVKEMTLSEIKKLNCPENQKIPTLQEVINLCKGKIDLQIELKTEGTPKLVNEIILKNKILPYILVTSFNINLLKEIKQLNPKIKIGFLFEKYSEKIWEFVELVSLEYICPKSDIVTKEMVEKAHNINIKVYAYHTDNKKLGVKLIKMGVDDIGTNFPRLFI